MLCGHEVHFNKSGQCSTIVFGGGTMPGWTTIVEHKGIVQTPAFCVQNDGCAQCHCIDGYNHVSTTHARRMVAPCLDTVTPRCALYS